MAFYPPKSPKNQNFEKMIKIDGNIIILHMCSKIIIIWCTVPDIQSKIDRIVCHFSPFFTFNSLMILKINFLEKWKNMLGDIILLQICTINEDHMVMVPEIYGAADRMFCHCRSFFCIFTPPWQPEKSKFWKIKKKSLEILSLNVRAP